MEYTKKIAKIKSTFLGREDHGIPTAYIHVDYGGSAQGIGGYDLRHEANSDWTTKMIDACGASSWEDLRGKTIHVLFLTDDAYGMPVGVEPLPTETGETFLFRETE